MALITKIPQMTAMLQCCNASRMPECQRIVFKGEKNWS
jgi:hypothetical protein